MSDLLGPVLSHRRIGEDRLMHRLVGFSDGGGGEPDGPFQRGDAYVGSPRRTDEFCQQGTLNA